MVHHLIGFDCKILTDNLTTHNKIQIEILLFSVYYIRFISATSITSYMEQHTDGIGPR